MPGRRFAFASVQGLRLSWSSPSLRAAIWQVLIIGVVLLIAWYLISNTSHTLAARHIATGFGFLGHVAGFPIGESLIPYDPAVSTFGRALWIGVLNTLKVSLIGIVLATVLGTLIGIGRLSANWLLARLTAFYVETLRDIPLLLQLLFWYALLHGLPGPRQAWQIGGAVFVSNRGIRFPLLHLAPVTWDMPVLRGFNFQGGGTISPEYFALLLGLVLYTSSYIAEIVRAGILAVPRGQWEAGEALGLRRAVVVRRIVLPQALRVIIPPLINQCLNLTKNSSLAVAIGFQDVMSIANTTLNQTGQAIEGISYIMSVYLAISLVISAIMNWYDGRVAVSGR